MAYRPPKPTGNTPVAIFMRWVWESIDRLEKLTGSNGALLKKTTRGTQVVVRPQEQAPTESGTTARWI